MSFGHCLVGRLRDQSNMSSTTWPISHLRSFRRLSGGHRRVGRWVRRFLREAVADWFVRDEDVPFMLQVIPIRPERRAQIPAVTHVDGTGRLQTVDRTNNPLYYSLIEAFFRITGVPMVLNTSFNESEPVVCRPQEALDCFLRTKMDVLVLGSYMVRRQ
jgi:carbamoyltransferase